MNTKDMMAAAYVAATIVAVLVLMWIAVGLVVHSTQAPPSAPGPTVTTTAPKVAAT